MLRHFIDYIMNTYKMKYKLHVATKLFIKNPYMICVDHEQTEYSGHVNLHGFRRQLKHTKSIMNATWGYTSPEWKTIESPPPSGPLINVLKGCHIANPFAINMRLISYWAFSDEQDALQFLLGQNSESKRIYMWPSNLKFNITEFLKDSN